MKVACLISGLLRAFPNHIEKMHKSFNKYDVDYFIHITDKPIDMYNNKDCNNEELISVLKPVSVIIENDRNYEKNKYVNVKKQWYKFSFINSVKNKYEKLNNIKYDIVIRIRPDVFILDENIKFENVVDGIIYGNNDEFFYGNRYTMNIVSNLITYFEKLSCYGDIMKKTDFFYKYIELKKFELKSIDIEHKLVLTECNILGIAGDSGSGKTTLLNNLDKLFTGDTLKLEGDRYHKWERGDKNWDNYTHLNPDANYICKFKEDVFKLKVGSNIYQVDYDHNNGKFTEKEKIESARNILVCGLHTLIDNKTNNLFNLKIFLDTDRKLRYYWKIKRDMNERGYNLKEVLEKIRLREKDSKKFIKPQKQRSDIIIRFFTEDNFNYMDLKREPKIYLSLSTSRNIYKFMGILDECNIEYILKKGINTELIFHEIQDFKNIFYRCVGKEVKNIKKNDYYTLIICFIVHVNSILKGSN